jgi:hypothetical protein
VPGIREGSNLGSGTCRSGAFGFWSYTNGQGCLALEAPGFDIIPNIDYKRSPNCVDRRYWESNCYPLSFGVGFSLIAALCLFYCLFFSIVFSDRRFGNPGLDVCNTLIVACVVLAFAFAICSSTNKSWTAITGGDRDRYFSPVLISIDGLGCWSIGDGAPGKNNPNRETSYCNLCHLGNRRFLFRVPWLRRSADYSGDDVVTRFCEVVRTCAGLSLTASGLLGLVAIFVIPFTKPLRFGEGNRTLAVVLAVVVALIWPPVALWREAHDSPYVQSYAGTGPAVEVALGGSYRVYTGACVLTTIAFVLCLIKAFVYPRFLAIPARPREPRPNARATRTTTALGSTEEPTHASLAVVTDLDAFETSAEGSDQVSEAPSYKRRGSTSSLPPPYPGPDGIEFRPSHEIENRQVTAETPGIAPPSFDFAVAAASADGTERSSEA